MKHTESFFEGTRGIALHSQCWLPEESSRAILAIVHGVTEHSGRYSNIVRPMLSAQLGVCGFDLRGHGRSLGRRGHVDSWQDYLSDLEVFLRKIRTSFPGLPIFLFGHSLGSLIVLAYVMEHPGAVVGVIVSGVPIDPVGVARPSIVALARIFSSIWPTFALTGIGPKPGRPPALSRDPRVEADFLADPLRLRQLTARWGVECLAMVASVKRRASSVKLPLLVIHGGSDPLNSLGGAQEFYNQVDFPDKQMQIYQDSYHEPHNDLDHERVVGDLRHWIERHL
ncbi:MAG: lysophospholipase [Verrucomicrobiota bacterium]